MKALGVVVMVVGVLAMLVGGYFLPGVIVLAVGAILVAVAPSAPRASRDPEGYDHPNAKPPAMDMRKLSKPDPAAQRQSQEEVLPEGVRRHQKNIADGVRRHRERMERGRRLRERKRGAA